ncbi:MAG: LURP-one-related family protein [Clostridia bacterium]|nr:LURP-one-related family protein [Clostridia bacterium]
MKLLNEERVFTWNDRFTVRDEGGNDRYYVEGELFSWGKKLHVCTPSGHEVAYIEQKLFTFKPRYQVFAGGALIGEVVREFSFFRPYYTVEGAGWDVEGEFWSHDYTVYRHGEPIVSIAKEWFTWGDCYALDIRDPADEIQALALVLAIDCAMEQDNN